MVSRTRYDGAASSWPETRIDKITITKGGDNLKNRPFVMWGRVSVNNIGKTRRIR
jgi:hypothetical protein